MKFLFRLFVVFATVVFAINAIWYLLLVGLLMTMRE